MMFPHPPLTRLSTLYRLLGIEPNLDAIIDAFEPKLERIDAEGGHFDELEIAGCPALVIYGGQDGPPGWKAEAESITLRSFDFVNRRCFLLLVLAVDEHVYALGFGDGHRYIPSHCKDARFGLSLAVRVADTERVRDLVRRRPGQRGRIDSTLSADGLPFWMIPLEQHQEIVSRLGSKTEDLNVTAGRNGERRVFVDGGTGLKARFGSRPESLVGDIREIAATLREKEPVPGLEFIEHVATVRDPALIRSLEDRIDEILADPEEALGLVELAVPNECLEEWDRTRFADIRIGSTTMRVEEVELDSILRRAAVQPTGSRLEALRKGKIRLYKDHGRTEELVHASAVKWIEATVFHGSHRYHLMDGVWLEIDAAYADSHNPLIEDLMTKPGGIELPAWKHGWKERGYLEYVAPSTPGMALLDQKFVFPDTGGRLELCDLLGPDDELIHVKQAKGSDSLSHLFKQALVSAQALQTSAEIRSKFADVVEQECQGRTLSRSFVPKKVVFAIRHYSGRPISVESLFPFSKIALADTATRLQDMGIEVQLIFIDTVPD